MCRSGYAASVRRVPALRKRSVYRAYGSGWHRAGAFEIDHLVPLELGGGNDAANLWPQPASPRPGFHEKDLLENYLHGEVCSGALSATVAQHEIAHDWVGAYRRLRRRRPNPNAERRSARARAQTS